MLWCGPGWLWRHWRPPRRSNWPFLLLDPRGQELLAAPAALGFVIGGLDRRTVALHLVRSRQDQATRQRPHGDRGGGMDQHQDQPEGHQHQSQAIARAAARLAGAPSSMFT